MNIPVNEPVITDAAKRYVAEAMESGWVSSGGQYIEKFEEAFASYIGVRHAVTTTSGTTALHLSLVSLGIGKGDEVIVPDFTMIASLTSILYTGAVPVFVDCERETYNIDSSLIEAAITERTKVIMPVHIYGHPCDMDPILAIAEKHHLKIIEDAAEVHGAEYNGHKCGSMGTINAFSFYGNKIITTGEGGMLVTNDDDLAMHARSLKDLAHAPGQRFLHKELGFNYRMTNLQAALGLGQLEHIDEFLQKKWWMADEYHKRLSGIKGLTLPITRDNVTNVYWMYGVLVEEGFGMSRDDLRAALKDKGVDTRDFFLPLHSQPLVHGVCSPQGSFPVTEEIAQRGFYLPSGLALTQEQLDYVCDCLEDIAHG